MGNGKLSTTRHVTPTRTTRTQRVQAQQQERKERAKFEVLKREAQRISTERLTGKTTAEYKEEYQTLTPEMKQFFVTPSELELKEERTKAGEIQKIDTRISYLQNQIKVEQERQERYRAEFQSLNPRDRDSRRQYYFNEIDRMRRQQQEYRDEIDTLRGSKSKVGEGYKAFDILEFAGEVAYGHRQKAESIRADKITFGTSISRSNR